jgi:uncharacterized protein (DUF342 family)
MSNEENDFMVTIDGSDYKFSQLSNDDKMLVSHIRDLEAQVEQLNFRFEQLSASKSFFADKLVASIRNSKSEENQAESAQDAQPQAVEQEVEISEPAQEQAEQA